MNSEPLMASNINDKIHGICLEDKDIYFASIKYPLLILFLARHQLHLDHELRQI